MGVYKISKKAASDLAKTYEYGIMTFGLHQAQFYLHTLHNHFQALADSIYLGRDASEFAPDLKRFSYKSHLIFYLYTDTGILIIRVLSHHMDFGRHL